MKTQQIPPVVGYVIAVVLVIGIGVAFWYTNLRTEPPADPRQFTEAQITDPDPPRLRDMQQNDGGRPQ